MKVHFGVTEPLPHDQNAKTFEVMPFSFMPNDGALKCSRRAPPSPSGATLLLLHPMMVYPEGPN